MEFDQTFDVLALCAAFDRRTVGEADAHAWHDVIGDLDFEDAKRAVRDHYRASREFVMPSDVRQRVVEIRKHRLAAVGDDAAVPDADPDDVPAYLEALRAGRMRRAGADGRPRNVRALTTRAFREVPRDDG